MLSLNLAMELLFASIYLFDLNYRKKEIMAEEKILIVDDEEIIRVSLQQDLLDEGFIVDIAEDGNTAIGMLDTKYDLIITDLMMEGIGGIEILKAAREKYPQQAVFILTGYGELDSAINALRLGAADYLLKPYNYEELLLRIGSCLEKRELQRKITLYEDILPICCECGKIRDDEGRERGTGEWFSVEQFFHKKMNLKSSHGYCDECGQKQLDAIRKFQLQRQKTIGIKK